MFRGNRNVHNPSRLMPSSSVYSIDIKDVPCRTTRGSGQTRFVSERIISHPFNDREEPNTPSRFEQTILSHAIHRHHHIPPSANHPTKPHPRSFPIYFHSLPIIPFTPLRQTLPSTLCPIPLPRSSLQQQPRVSHPPSPSLTPPTPSTSLPLSPPV